jgi:hypothetical protein
MLFNVISDETKIHTLNDPVLKFAEIVLKC